jgi:hypothetical protein
MKFDIKKTLTDTFQAASTIVSGVVGEAAVQVAPAVDFVQAKAEEFKAKSAETVKAIRTFWSH